MTGLLIDVISVLLRAWGAMLLFGAIHHDVWPPLPAFGWWGTLAIVLLLDSLLSGAVTDGLATERVKVTGG